VAVGGDYLENSSELWFNRLTPHALVDEFRPIQEKLKMTGHTMIRKELMKAVSG
jgi:hypothetical protein